MARIIRESGSKNIRKFNNFTTSSIVASVVNIIIGVLVFIFSEQIGTLIGYIAGLIFIYTGILAIYKFIKRDGAKLYSLNIIFGILSVILGVVIIFVPTSVISYINIIFGIFLIILGGNKVTYGIWFKIGDDASWSITLVSGIMLILFGVLLIANPFESFLTATKLVGIFLILYNVLDITTSIMLRKRSDEIVKIFW